MHCHENFKKKFTQVCRSKENALASPARPGFTDFTTFVSSQKPFNSPKYSLMTDLLTVKKCSLYTQVIHMILKKLWAQESKSVIKKFKYDSYFFKMCLTSDLNPRPSGNSNEWISIHFTWTYMYIVCTCVYLYSLGDPRHASRFYFCIL